MIKNSLFIALAFWLISLQTYADDQSIRQKNLFRQIRCSTCQGQSIDESNTEPAEIMKEFIITQISLGKTDKEILADVREKYGDFLVFRPELSIHTIMLWALPFLVFGLLILVIRKKVKPFN